MFVLGMSVFSETTNAQTLRGFGRQDSVEIRKTARRIIDSSEFRRLRRSRSRQLPRVGPKGSGGSGTSGENSSSGNRNDGNKTQRSQDDTDRDAGKTPPDQQDAESDLFSGPQMASSPLGEIVGGAFRLVSLICLAILCGAILFLIVKAVRNYERSSKPIDDETLDGSPTDEIQLEQAPGEIPADVYAARAKELAGGGQYREAIAQLLLGAMSHLERSELIRYRRGLTLRDYLRAARAEQRHYTALKSMVQVYEPLGFGRRPANEQLFQRTLSGYETGFHGTI